MRSSIWSLQMLCCCEFMQEIIRHVKVREVEISLSIAQTLLSVFGEALWVDRCCKKDRLSVSRFFLALSIEHQLSAVISQSAFWSSFVNYRTRLRVTRSSENIHVLSAGVNEGQVSDFTSFNGLIFCQPAEPVTSSSVLWGGWILFLAYMIQVTSSRTKS